MKIYDETNKTRSHMIMFFSRIMRKYVNYYSMMNSANVSLVQVIWNKCSIKF